MPDPRLLDLPGAAAYLSLSPRFVRVLVERGDLVSVRIGRRLLFDVQDLDQLVQRWKAESTNAPNQQLSAAAIKGWRSTPVRKRGAA